jgi:hypothetical protein
VGTGLLDDAIRLHGEHVMLARKLNCMLIPAAAAFALAIAERPSVKLYLPDKQHPNALGTYFVASLFYRKLFNKKADNLPLKSYRSYSEKLPKNPTPVKILIKNAKFLWAIANKIE